MNMNRFIFLIAIFGLFGCSKDEGISVQEQLAIDVAIIDDYLEDNGIVAEVHESKIRYVVTQEGTGGTPALGNVVAFKYEGRLLDGEVFTKSTYAQTYTLNFPLLECLQLMITEMKEGGKMTFYSPSAYALGTGGNNLVPPNSIVVFDVELVKIIDDEMDQFALDTSIIDEYLANNEITALEHSSGIRYVVLQEGDGNSPIATDDVQVRYKGYYLNGSVFDQDNSITGARIPLGNVIDAWKLMIPEMKEGGKIVFYAQSKYCYGPNGSSSIPPNAILIFEVELLSILVL